MTALVGCALRPRTGEATCGDVAAVIPFSQGVMLFLADGLGHGEGARDSAEAACAHARACAEEPLETLLRGVDRVLQGMRGAAISVLSLHLGEGRASFAGIGNVELRAVAHVPIAPAATPGIVGRRVRTVRVRDYPIAPGDLLVLTTDGVSTRFDLKELAHLEVQALADTIVARHHKEHDDAACLVARVAA